MIMKLEAAVKYFSPKGMSPELVSPTTSPDALNGTDIMAAIGLAQSKSWFGVSLFLAKMGIEDKERCVVELTRYAVYKAPQPIRKACGSKLEQCMRILAVYAFIDYSRSADSIRVCDACQGDKFIEKFTFTHNLYAEKRMAMMGPPTKALMKELKVTKVNRHDQNLVACKKCNGKGVISDACRCNGTGKTIDREKTKLAGVPVYKTCNKCDGRGYARMPSSIAYKSILNVVNELSQPSWSRHWKPFYEHLCTQCYKEESISNSLFSKVTR